MRSSTDSPDSPPPEAIFDAALNLSADERAAYLDKACEGNTALRERVAALLRAHDDSIGFLPESPAVESFNTLPVGRVLGDYELLEEIGRGGMGVVYRARQRSLDRVVALKVLPAAWFAGADARRRFRSEAGAAAALQHPNIVSIHEVGDCEGQPYYSMDYIEGRNLAELVRDRPMAARQAAALVKSIAEAVHHAHAHGVLHRDLKPSNVLIDLSGQPRITDFGLAKRFVPQRFQHEAPSVLSSAGAGEEPDHSGDSVDSRGDKLAHSETERSAPRAIDLTLPGQVIGSPNYMPPEQASARRGKVGPPCDIYSLGAILFHLVTGRPPFQAESMGETLVQLLYVEPLSPRVLNASVPRDLETICLKCLSKEPSRRYATAQALADDLGRLLEGQPIRARPTGSMARLIKWSRRHPAQAIAAVSLIGVVIVSTWAAIHLRNLNRELLLNLYVQDLNVALRSWQEGNKSQTLALLKQHIPHGQDADLRGFEWRYLWRLCRGDFSRWLPKHRQVVGSLQFSPDGRRLATYTWDGTLRVWPLVPQGNLLTVTQVTGWAGFTEDGRNLLAGRTGTSVQFLDAESGVTNRTLPNAGELVAFAPRAQLVVVITRDDVLKVLHPSESSPRLSVPGVTCRKLDFGWGDPVAISANGRWLALIQPGASPLRPDLAIRLWDLETGQESPSLSEDRQLRCLEFSPNGAVLAVGDGNGMVKVWNLATRNFIPLLAHERPVLSLAFSADSEVMATGSADQRSIRLWKTRNGEPVTRTFLGQVGDVWSLAFSPDGLLLASGSRDSPVRIWNLEASDVGEVVPNRLHADEFGNFCFSPDGHLMAGGCEDNTVRVWDVATQNVRSVLRNAIYVVAFSREGHELLVSTRDGAPQWWNFESHTTRSVPGYRDRLGRVISVDLSPDRRIAALGLADGEIQLLEIDSGRLLGQSLAGHQGAVRSLAFSPFGDKLASGSSDKSVVVWDVLSQRRLDMCPEHKGAVFGVAISPNGQLLASGCGAETIKLWALSNVSTGSLASISLHSSVIRTLTFSPDGRTLASGSEDKTVKLWNLATRKEVASFQFEDKIRLVAFSPDGNALAVVTDGGQLRILRAASLGETEPDW